MHPVVFNYKIRCKQITIEHNFMKYSYSYMIRPHGVIIWLIYKTIQRITCCTALVNAVMNLRVP